jgi:hypothetical protein
MEEYTNKDSIKEIPGISMICIPENLPCVSPEEQSDIEKRYGLPKQDVAKTLTIDL